MGTGDEYNYNKVIDEIISKSLFTHRQIEIILHSRTEGAPAPPISRGAYHRQRRQCRDKSVALFYSTILAYGLGVFPRGSLDVLEQLSGQVGVIFGSDVDGAAADEILDVLDGAVRSALDM